MHLVVQARGVVRGINLRVGAVELAANVYTQFTPIQDAPVGLTLGAHTNVFVIVRAGAERDATQGGLVNEGRRSQHFVVVTRAAVSLVIVNAVITGGEPAPLALTEGQGDRVKGGISRALEPPRVLNNRVDEVGFSCRVE